MPYVAMTRPPKQSDDDYWYEEPRSITVIEPVDEPRDTGLVDARGVAIYFLGERRRIGF